MSYRYETTNFQKWDVEGLLKNSVEFSLVYSCCAMLRSKIVFKINLVEFLKEGYLHFKMFV